MSYVRKLMTCPQLGSRRWASISNQCSQVNWSKPTAGDISKLGEVGRENPQNARILRNKAFLADFLGRNTTKERLRTMFWLFVMAARME